MSQHRISKTPRSHPLIFIAAIFIASILIYPFIIPLMLSVITAYVLLPLVKRFEVYTRSYNIALGIIVVIIGITIILAVWYLSANTAIFFQDISGLGAKFQEIISGISNTLKEVGFGTYTGYFVSAQDITSKITAFAITVISDLLKSIPFFLLESVIFLYATYHFMRNGQKIIDFVRAYAATLPVEDEHFIKSILNGLKRGFDVLFLSYFTISLILAGSSLVGYVVFGVPHAFLLAILTGLFGFLPIFGVWMVYVPAAAYMYYSGNIFAAAGLMIYSVLVLTIFIPVFLQPYLGAKKSGVSALTILLGFFSGPVIFGAKGVLLGPILFVIIETIIVEYMRYRISGHDSLE